jgi:hypothetical protein
MAAKSPVVRHLLWLFLLIAVLAGSLVIPRLAPRLPRLSLKITEAREHPFTALFQDYLRINTSQPRGDTYSAAVFLAMALQEHGITAEIYEPVPGKANLVAVLQGGRGTEPPLILHHHMDTAELYRPDLWKYDPWGGIIWGPFLYGLGAIDMKSYGICFLETFIKAHEERWPLSRTVIYYASCAEETNFVAGSHWMLQNHPEYFPPGAIFLTEGGMTEMTTGEMRFIGIEVGQKSFARFQMRLTPGQKNEVEPLVRSLVPSGPVLHPEVVRQLREIHPFRMAPYRACLLDVESCVKGRAYADVRLPGYIKDLMYSQAFWVRLGDGTDRLVIAALWDEPIQAYADQAARILADRGIAFEEFVTPTARITPAGTPAFKSIVRAHEAMYPGIPVFPYLQGSSYTEASLFRDRGLLCYGIVPVRYNIYDSLNMNLYDERVYLPYFLDGFDFSEALVRSLAVRK